MSALKFTFLFVIILLVQNGSGNGHWGYERHNGPATWGGTCANGKKQSPIDIVPDQAEVLDSPDCKLSDDYHRDTALEAIANGHSVECRPLSGDFTLSHRGKEYAFSQLHFHWGCSEHRLKRRCFDAEGHFVHTNKNHDPNDSSSNSHLVIGVFFKTSYQLDRRVERFVLDMLDITSRSMQYAPMTHQHSIASIMPSCSGTYTTYSGSLTTPDCSEVVEWVNYLRPVPLSAKIMYKFKQVKGSDGEPLKYNFRPVQPLNGRTVHLRPGNGGNGSDISKPWNFLHALSAFIAAYNSIN